MTFIFVYVWMMSTLWVTRNPFPSLSTFHASFSVVTIFIGAALYLKTRTASVAEGRLFSRPCVWLRCVLFIWFCAAVTSLFLQHSKAFYHPIDLLIFNAKEKHQLWVAQAAGSPNLQHAVWEYQRRYRRHPPPYVYFPFIKPDVFTNIIVVDSTSGTISQPPDRLWL